MSQNILIIDDSAVDRALMKFLIKNYLPDIEIHELSEGSNTFNIIEMYSISTVILDLKMPGKDGYVILSELKNHILSRDIPVIVCTAVIESDSLHKILSLGAFDYFLKPLSEEAMKFSLPLKVKNAIALNDRIRFIDEQSKLDPLTQLFNRSYFKKILSDYPVTEHVQVTILIGDINGLKIANDAFGSDFGDKILVDLSQVLKQVCPETSVFCRWGGDEFVIIIPDQPIQKIENYAIQINELFSEISYLGLHLSITFGWDSLQAPNIDLHKILVNSEDAMIRSKMHEDGSIRSNMMCAIMKTLIEKNPREEAHSRRVSELCNKMGRCLALSKREVKDLKLIGLLHDIGKIAIDERILNKPGKLDTQECYEIRRHPEIGYRILNASTEMMHFAEIILSHHERIDGKGYPNGLSGENIPLFSKILAIADAYDAMTCERTYKRVLNNSEAIDELRNCAGQQFDEELVDVFINKVIGNMNQDCVV